MGSLDDYFAAYEAAGGGAVDRERFHFWLVYRTLWWALGCLQMGQAWRSGADPTVERVVVGRRTAEQELDLLLLLEAEAPAAECDRALPSLSPAVSAPTGEPTNREELLAYEVTVGNLREHLTRQRQPMTREEIAAVFEVGARCAEAFHGIKENP